MSNQANQSSLIKSSSFQKKQRLRLSSTLAKLFSRVKKQLEPSTNQNVGLFVVACETIVIVLSLKGGGGVEKGASSNRKHGLFHPNVFRELRLKPR